MLIKFISLQNYHYTRVMELLGLNDNKKIGMGLLLMATLFYVMGIIFLFRRSLILLSNLFFLLGLYFFIGVAGTLKFFTKKGKVRGSITYFAGMAIIVFDFTLIGVIVQIFGFFIIFRAFLPDFYEYICRLPLIGRYLKSYWLQNALDRLAGRESRI